MMSKGTLSFLVAVTLAFSAGCQSSEEAPKAEQYLRFDALTTPKRSNTDRDRRRRDDR